MSEYDGPNHADYALDPHEQFWDDKERNFPRGHAPSWRGDDAPSELGWGDVYTDDEEPVHHLDPGFPEHEVDIHRDPDHGREEHRMGAILRQAEQYPDPGHYTDYGPEENDWEHQREHETQLLTPEQTGLEHTVLACRNPQNNGWDILRHLD